MIQTIRHETRIAVILPAAHRVAFQAVGDRRSHAGDTAGTGAGERKRAGSDVMRFVYRPERASRLG